MKKLLLYSLASLLAMPLLFSSIRGQEKFPTGTYTGGGFELAFGADGVFTVSQNAKAVVKGNYVIEKDQITLNDKEGDFACLGQPGKYTWAFDGKNLSFTKVEDECGGRVQALPAQPWTKK